MCCAVSIDLLASSNGNGVAFGVVDLHATDEGFRCWWLIVIFPSGRCDQCNDQVTACVRARMGLNDVVQARG